MTHAILLYEGVRGWEALAALAALREAGKDARLCAAEALVATQEGARIVPHALGLALVESAEALVVPGGDVARAMADAALARALRARRGRWTIASGGGVRLVALAGLAEERAVAVAPGEARIDGAGEARPARLVADGRLLTCHAGDALADLVLHYVGQVDGHEAARRVAHALGREHRPFAMGAGPA